VISDIRGWPLVSVLVVAMAAALSGCGEGASGTQVAPQAVRGEIMDVQSRDLLQIETLTVRDAEGRTWVFEARKTLEFTPSHLREHMVLGEVVEVTFHQEGDVLVADRLAD